jgi:thioredoxin 1
MPYLMLRKKAIEPLYESWSEFRFWKELAKKMGDAVEIRKVDVDQHMDLAEKYGIRVVPTLIIEKDGKIVQSMEGVTDLSTLEKLLTPLVG